MDDESGEVAYVAGTIPQGCWGHFFPSLSTGWTAKQITKE